MRDVGFRLIIVVIGDKVFHRILGKEFFKLTAQLGGQCFVVCQNKGRAVQPGNHIGHRKSLAGAGNTQKHLLVDSVFNSRHKTVNGLRLISCRLKL